MPYQLSCLHVGKHKTIMHYSLLIFSLHIELLDDCFIFQNIGKFQIPDTLFRKTNAILDFEDKNDKPEIVYLSS